MPKTAHCSKSSEDSQQRMVSHIHSTQFIQHEHCAHIFTISLHLIQTATLTCSCT